MRLEPATSADLPELHGDVIVTYGDVPLLTGDTLGELVQAHRAQASAVTVLTAQVSDPTGYGRVLRDRSGHVSGVVEHRDADEEQLRITEINSGIYVFDAETLKAGLAELRPDNSQGELYLTDVLASARRAGPAPGGAHGSGTRRFMRRDGGQPEALPPRFGPG